MIEVRIFVRDYKGGNEVWGCIGSRVDREEVGVERRYKGKNDEILIKI